MNLLLFLMYSISTLAFVEPENISYSKTPGYGKVEGFGIFEWDEKSKTKKNRVTATLSPPKGLSVRWFGTTGFEIRDEETTVLIDPFFSRPPISKMFGLQKLKVDTEAVEKYLFNHLDMKNVKVILTSHCHYDHVMDIPFILSRYTNATDRPLVVGTSNIKKLLENHQGREKKIPWLKGTDALSETPTQVIEFTKDDLKTPDTTKPYGRLVGYFGKFKVTVFPSLHNDYDDIAYDFSGEISKKPPMKSNDYRAYLNSTLVYLIEYNGKALKIFFSDSPTFGNLIRIVWEVGKADLHFQGITGRKRDNDIPGTILGIQPKFFIPTHFDNFFKSFREFKEFDTKVKFISDNSRYAEFIKNFDKKYAVGSDAELRLMKMHYYYSLNGLLE